MINDLYKMADDYICKDDFKNAIILFEKSLESGDFRSAFRLGLIYIDCYEDIGYSKPDYKEAIKYFEIGAHNNNSDCQKELFQIYKSKENFNLEKAIYYGLTSIKSLEQQDIKRIINMINDFGEKSIQVSSIENAKHTITVFDEFIKITNKDSILDYLFEPRNILIKKLCKKMVYNSKNIIDLQHNFDFFEKYLNEKFMHQIKIFKESCDNLLLDVESLDEFDININEKKETAESKHIIIKKILADLSEVNNNYKIAISVDNDCKQILSIYEKMFYEYQEQEAFDLLARKYKYNKNKLNELLKIAVKHGLQLSSSQLKLAKPYSINNYKLVNTKELEQIDTKNNIIYYMYAYYPSRFNIIENYEAFMSVKNRCYNPEHSHINFPAALQNFFRFFNDEWIVCTVPGHEKTDNISNGVSDVINMVKVKQVRLINELIGRKYYTEKKAYSSAKRDYKKDMESLKIIDDYDITGKSIIVVDDITTSGSSLIACRNILMDAGAEEVVLLALGKTMSWKGKWNEYGY